MSEARNRNWMMPGLFAIAMLLITRVLATAPYWLPWLGWISFGGAVMLALMAIFNLYDLRRNQDMWFLERRQNALAHTPLATQIEAARGVSPEVTKIIINEWRRVWMLKSGVGDSGPHSVLFGAPDVTEYFLQYFLESSTDKSVMPKRLLSEGRKNRFDPWGVVDEYTMYDRLIALLAKQGKVQRWSEYDNYEWVEPWTPALVAVDYGLEWKESESTIGAKVVEEIQS
jgi:hypothetical protein